MTNIFKVPLRGIYDDALFIAFRVQPCLKTSLHHLLFLCLCSIKFKCKVTVQEDGGPVSPMRTEGQDQELRLVLNGHIYL